MNNFINNRWAQVFAATVLIVGGVMFYNNDSATDADGEDVTEASIAGVTATTMVGETVNASAGNTIIQEEVIVGNEVKKDEDVNSVQTTDGTDMNNTGTNNTEN